MLNYLKVIGKTLCERHNYSIMLIILVTIISPERSLSKLKMIKFYLCVRVCRKRDSMIVHDIWIVDDIR